jgi:hypothetical protein
MRMAVVGTPEESRRACALPLHGRHSLIRVPDGDRATMAALLPGLVGGLLGTIAMTLLMKLAGGGLPPTADLLAKFGGGDPADYAKPGLLLHLGYGTVAGAVFALGLPVLGVGLDSIAVAVAFGLAYGILLMVGGMVFWLRSVIGASPDREAKLRFAAVHLVYGALLGAVVGAGLLG